MNSEKKQYFTRRITQANSTEMVVILYDMTLEYISDAKNALENSNPVEDFYKAISGIQGCFSELNASLNYEYEPAIGLRMLYRYCIGRVGVSQAKMDAGILGDVEKVIRPLRDAYDKISDQNTSGPVMENSQTVYAGYTYGRTDVNENYVGLGNRGFLA